MQTRLGSVSANGMDGDRKIAIAGGALILLTVFVGTSASAMIYAALTLALGIYEYINVQEVLEEADSGFVQASVGWGIYAILRAAVAALLGSLVMNGRKPSAVPI